MRDAALELADLQAHDDLVARIYADHLPGEVRELALALAWVRPVPARRQRLALFVTADDAPGVSAR